MKLDTLEIAYTIDVIEKLIESSNGYIDDGSWIEPLTDDIKNAHQLVRKLKKLLKQEVSA